MAKQLVEDALRLPIGEIRRELSGWSVMRWYRGDVQTAAISLLITGPDVLTLSYSVDDEPQSYPVRLTATPVYRAQRGRLWFVCPARGCERRCGTLYLPPGGRIFACRQCYDLAYEGQQDRM